MAYGWPAQDASPRFVVYGLIDGRVSLLGDFEGFATWRLRDGTPRVVIHQDHVPSRTYVWNGHGFDDARDAGR